MDSLTAADGTEIWYSTHGDRSCPAIFLGPHFYASFGRSEGDDTSLWINGLKEEFFLIVADYPRGFGRTGNPLGLAFTPDVASEEYCRIADAAGAGQFGWVGYSYGGAIGVQVACRSGRVAALAVGGFPPLNAPFQEMAKISTQMAAESSASAEANQKLLWSAAGFYTPLTDWPEYDQVTMLAMPRMTFIGTEDVGVPLHGVDLPLAATVRTAAPALNKLGWEIEWLHGQDHLSAVGAAVSLPVVRDFFRRALTVD